MIQRKKQIKKFKNIKYFLNYQVLSYGHRERLRGAWRSHNSQAHQENGFTLIELASVMSVLALLLVIIVFAVNISKMKSRDSLRLSHVRGIGIILDNEDIQSPSSDIVGCVEPNSLIQSCAGPKRILDIKNFTDPKIGASNPCKGGDTALKTICGYSISNSSGQGNPKTNDYEICFYLERGTKDFPRGIYSIKAGGVIGAGCD